MAIETRNSAHIVDPWHVTIGPPRAPTLSGLAHCDGALGVGEGRAQRATPLKVWRGFPQDSLSPSLKIRPEGRSAPRGISAADPVTAQAVGDPERAVRRALPPGNALALDGDDRALANQSGGLGWLDSTQPKA